MTEKKLKIAIICSSGGHLLQFMQLKEWWCKHDRFWFTFDKPDSRSLLKKEKVYWGYYPTTRNYWNLIRNGFKTIKILFIEKPDIIVSTGAGIAIPAFYLAKLFHSKTIFIEAFNRVESPTLTGRIVSPVSDAFYVQWDSQMKFYRKAKFLGRLL